jgi:molybdopterin-containing oxidoreductase family iron-sulfur binding subunit
MAIDLARCTGCNACTVSCKAENNVPLSDPVAIEEKRAISWLEVLELPTGDGRGVPRLKYMPRPCMHCDHPPCTKVCPVYATALDEDGLVNQVYDRCIGCRYCTNNCPYTVKYFNFVTPTWPDEMLHTLNPEVTIRPKGVVEKCTFCHHRLQKAREQARAERRPLQEDDYIPACVEICPTRAIVFGDLDDPRSKVTRQIGLPRVYRPLEDLGTEPKVYYLDEDF